MKKILTVFFLTLISITIVFVSAVLPQSGFDLLTESVSEEQKSFLWKVQSSTSTIHILGSMHLAKRSLYPLDRKIEQAFDKSDILVVEVNLSSLAPAFILKKFNEKGIYQDGTTLGDHLTDETFSRLVEKMNRLGVDINQLNMFKPWCLAMNLVTIELLRLGFNPSKGLDQYFLNKAQGNKDVLELETFEFQLNLFDDFTEAQQELFLFSTLVDLDIIENQMNEMIAAWKTGDVGTMEAILRKGLGENPELLPIYDKMFFQRNKTMALKIEEFLQTRKDYFVVVGAGHLVGKEGIIQLLKKRGYPPKQL